MDGTWVWLDRPQPENNIYNADAFSGTNFRDVGVDILQLPFRAPPNLNGLTAGNDPIPLPGDSRMIWDIFFSVDREAVGQPFTAVNTAQMGDNEASHVYVTNPFFVGGHVLMAVNNALGLAGPDDRPAAAPVDDLDAMELKDSRFQPEPPYPGFSGQGNNVLELDIPHFTVNGSATIFAPNYNTVYADLTTVGLVAGDDIDALVLDKDNGRALFHSLPVARRWQILPTRLSDPLDHVRPAGTADIFFADLAMGTVEVAGPTNVSYPFPLIAENLGLLPSDNLDALDVTDSPTVYQIPDDPVLLQFYVDQELSVVDECFGNACAEVVYAYPDAFDMNDLSGTVFVIGDRGVLSNDFTVARGFGDIALEAEVLEPPLYGELTLNQDGSFMYVPINPANPRGDSFTYVASTLDSSAVATVTLDATTCDFNGDAVCDTTDIDLLVAELAANGEDPLFDVNSDGVVDGKDVAAWLSEAGKLNLPSAAPYLFGDANLDGMVDGSDFNAWNGNKFSSVAAWSFGDFNVDGQIDGSDFGIWNLNKFSTSVQINSLPEPTVPALLAILAGLGSSRWCPTRP